MAVGFLVCVALKFALLCGAKYGAMGYLRDGGRSQVYGNGLCGAVVVNFVCCVAVGFASCVTVGFAELVYVGLVNCVAVSVLGCVIEGLVGCEVVGYVES